MAAAAEGKPIETQVPILLSVVKNVNKPPQSRLAALDQLSSVLVSGRRDSDLSTAVIAQGWSGSNDDMNDDVPLKYLTEHLEGELLPALGQVMLDRDVFVASRAALVLARAGAALGRDAEPFFHWAVKGVEMQAVQDPVRLSIHLSVVSIALQLGQRDCMKPLVSQLLTRLSSLLETVAHYQMVTPLIQTIQVIAGLFADDFESIMCDVVDLLVGWSLDPEVPESARLTITGTFANFKHLWHAHLPFASSVLRKLLSDMEALAQIVINSVVVTSAAATAAAVTEDARAGDGSNDSNAVNSAGRAGAGGRGERSGGGGGGDAGAGGPGAAEVKASAELQRLALCFVGIVEGVGEELGAEEEEAMLKRYLHCVCGTVMSLKACWAAAPSVPRAGGGSTAGRGGRGGGRGGRGDKSGASKEAFTLGTWVDLARGAGRRVMQLVLALLRRRSGRASVHAAHAAQHVHVLLRAIEAAVASPPASLASSGDTTPLVAALDDVCEAILAESPGSRVGGVAGCSGHRGGGGVARERDSVSLVYEVAKLLVGGHEHCVVGGRDAAGIRQEGKNEANWLAELRLHWDVKVALAVRRLYVALLRKGMPALSISGAMSRRSHHDVSQAVAGAIPEDLCRGSPPEGGRGDSSEEATAEDRLEVAGLYLLELESVCREIGSENESLLLEAQGVCEGVCVNRGTGRCPDRDPTLADEPTQAHAALDPTMAHAPQRKKMASWEAIQNSIDGLRRLEVLGVFLCGVLLEVFREKERERGGGGLASGGASANEWAGEGEWNHAQRGGGGGFWGIAVGIPEMVVSCAERVAAPRHGVRGCQALPVSNLKVLLVQLLASVQPLLMPTPPDWIVSNGEKHAVRLASFRHRAALVLLRSISSGVRTYAHAHAHARARARARAHTHTHTHTHTCSC